MRYLARKRYGILERNYRTGHGEIDLVMRGERVLVFVEVKLRRVTLSSDDFGFVTTDSRQIGYNMYPYDAF